MRLNFINMQINNFLNMYIYIVQKLLPISKSFKLLNIKHGEDSYSDELFNHLQGSQAH